MHEPTRHEVYIFFFNTRVGGERERILYCCKINPLYMFVGGMPLVRK